MSKSERGGFFDESTIVHASCMFRRGVLEKVSGYSTQKNRIRVEDYDMLLRIYESGYQGANLSEILYFIRRNRAQYKRRKVSISF